MLVFLVSLRTASCGDTSVVYTCVSYCLSMVVFVYTLTLSESTVYNRLESCLCYGDITFGPTNGGVALMSYSRGVGISSFTSSFSSFTWNIVVAGPLLYRLEHELAAFINLLFDHLLFDGLGEADFAVE